jgi:hypothetical protein
MTTTVCLQLPTSTVELLALIDRVYDPLYQFARDEHHRPVWVGMRLPLQPLTLAWQQQGWNLERLEERLQAAESSKHLLRIAQDSPAKLASAEKQPDSQLQLLPDPEFQLPWIDLSCLKAELLPLRSRRPQKDLRLRPLYPGPRRMPPGCFERKQLYQWLRWGKPFQLAGGGGLAAIVLAESQAWKLLDRDVSARLAPLASKASGRSPYAQPAAEDALRIVDIDLAQFRLTDFMEQWSGQIVPRLVADELEPNSLDGVRLSLGEDFNRRVYDAEVAEEFFLKDPILLVHPSLLNYGQLLKTSRTPLKSKAVQIVPAPTRSQAAAQRANDQVDPERPSQTAVSRPASTIVALKPKGLVR